MNSKCCIVMRLKSCVILALRSPWVVCSSEPRSTSFALAERARIPFGKHEAGLAVRKDVCQALLNSLVRKQHGKDLGNPGEFSVLEHECIGPQVLPAGAQI